MQQNHRLTCYRILKINGLELGVRSTTCLITVESVPTIYTAGCACGAVVLCGCITFTLEPINVWFYKSNPPLSEI